MRPVSHRVADHLFEALRSDDGEGNDELETVAELGALEGMVIANRFVIVRKLGSGGTGDVYEATDRQSGKSVALKLPTHRGGRGIRRFNEEARASEMLSGAGFARFIARGTEEAPFLATEIAEGETLREALLRGPMDPRRALFVVRRLAAALATMHSRGWAHRDVKPANILVSDRELKLIDFGISRDAAGPGLGTRPGDLLGTVPYMAPEQLSPSRRRAVNPSVRGITADVFALGAVFYECLTARRAFPRTELKLPLSGDVIEASPRVVASKLRIPPRAAMLLTQMMAPFPEARPVDAVHVLRELLAIEERAPQMPVDSGAPLVAALAAALDGAVAVTGANRARRETFARSIVALVEELRPESVVTLVTDADLCDRTDLRKKLATVGHAATLVATSGAIDLPFAMVDLGHANLGHADLGHAGESRLMATLSAFDRWVLRLAAASGPSFSELVVAALVDGPEAGRVPTTLDRLVEMELISEDPQPGDGGRRFSFRRPGLRDLVRAASRSCNLALAHSVAVHLEKRR